MLEELLVHGAVLMGYRTLMALGFTLVFGVTRLFYLTHGAIYMLGGYIGYICLVILGLHPIMAFLLVLVVCITSAVATTRVFLFPLRKEELGVLLVSFAIAVIFEQVVRLALLPTARYLPPFIPGSSEIIGVTISNQRILVLVVAFILIVGLWLFINKTWIGRALRALSEDEVLASLMGIHTERLILFVFALAAAYSATAGFMVSPILVLYPSSGWLPLIESVTIVILGGLGNVEGTIVSAAIMSYAQVSVAFFISPAYSSLVVFAILIFILLFKPRGLFGGRV